MPDPGLTGSLETTFPFEIKLPMGAPASMMICDGFTGRESLSQMQYVLSAQFIPAEEKGWADEKQGLSLFRASIPITVVKPMLLKKMLKGDFHQVEQRAGGVAGLFKSLSTSVISIFENDFHLGQTMCVRIVCNNSACRIDVKEFTLELNRTHTVKRDDEPIKVHSITVARSSFSGTKAFEKSDQICWLTIPMTDDFFCLNKQKLLQPFVPTFTGEIVQVSYELTVRVKHRWGVQPDEIEHATWPINIYQSPAQASLEE